MITIQDLRDHLDEVVTRVKAGEQLTITRSGQPVAELHPVRRRPAAAASLLERWSKLPAVDPLALRRDLDQLVDKTL